MELKKINDIYSNQNLSIKINVHQKNDIDKKIINNNDNDSNKTSSLSRTIMSNSDINKDSSDQFEYIVNNLLKGNIEKEKLINLANILYKFNFKLMKYNDKNNTIKFVSAYLNHISKKKMKIQVKIQKQIIVMVLKKQIQYFNIILINLYAQMIQIILILI